MRAAGGRGAGLFRMVGHVWRHPSNEGRRLRQLGQAVRFQVRARALGRPTVVALGDRSVVEARLRSAASVQVAFANPPDLGPWLVWQRHLRAGALFVDVGANVGTYSVLAGELGARVVAFEPDASNADFLRSNLRLNGLEAQIHVAALADREGSMAFTSGLDSMNRLLPGGGSARSVPVMTIDTCFPLDEIAGVKVDVEGAEGLVLRGAQQALAAGRIGLLQLEWNLMSRVEFGEGRDVVATLLRGHGYSLYRPDADGCLVPDAGDERADDVFAARPETVAAVNGSPGPTGPGTRRPLRGRRPRTRLS